MLIQRWARRRRRTRRTAAWVPGHRWHIQAAADEWQSPYTCPWRLRRCPGRRRLPEGFRIALKGRRQGGGAFFCLSQLQTATHTHMPDSCGVRLRLVAVAAAVFTFFRSISRCKCSAVALRWNKKWGLTAELSFSERMTGESPAVQQ